MVSYTYPVGNLTNIPYSNSTYLNNYYTNDVYTFSISNTSSINLNLHNITAGDNAEIVLYRDANNNSVFDGGDQFLTGSYRGGNSDDSINYLADAGNYIAVVVKHYTDSDNFLNYELDLSATPDTPYPADTEPPNLLPHELEVNNLTFEFNNPMTFSYSGWVGDTDTVDTYAFSLPDFGFGQAGGDTAVVNISLTGLISDADIRVIKDFNNNHIVDSGEVIGSSTNGSNFSELIEQIGITGPGDYFVQVYQYSGNTNYQLNFETGILVG